MFENTEWIFFDIGYTLINEEAVWKCRCKEQSMTKEAINLGLTADDIYHAIEEASICYQPQYRTVAKKYKFTEIALGKANCIPEKAIMIGDRLDNDIYPAKKLGMKTIWIKQGFGGIQKPISEEYVPDREVNNLVELLKILKV